MYFQHLKETDQDIYELIGKEQKRQGENIELIASENFVSRAVLEATGSVLTNKYAEGYPGKRYYGGCEIVDQIEDIARERLTSLFGAEHANVQPHSGSSANIAVYFAFLEKGDKVLGMSLAEGGHLTHGSPVNISGMYYNFVSYGVDADSEYIDYDEVRRIAKAEKPKILLAGATAYPRTLDFKKFREIADEVGAYLMVDMAHIAGLVAAGLHPNPVPYSDFVTTTTHKTLRGPRGAAILCKKEHAKAIDKAIFPGMQGGPLQHVIAAKAVAFKEAAAPEFAEYSKQIIANAKALEKSFLKHGLRMVSGGTDNHLLLIDVSSLGITGKEAQQMLEDVRITTNKNTIPNDTKSPFVTSGIRVGTPAVTTRGMKEAEMEEIGELIFLTLSKKENPAQIIERVDNVIRRFPLYENLN